MSLLTTFTKNHFPVTFGSHLEFLHKMQKCIYLGNGARLSDFDEIFYPQGICIVYWQLFAKVASPPLLEAVMNFRVKHKSTLSRKRCEIERFQQKFDPQGICIVYWGLFPKITFLPLFAAILNFCIKCKSAFILKTVQDR